MIIEVRIEIGNNKPLLFSMNLGFIHINPDHPTFIRMVYSDESNTLRIDSMHFETRDIIIDEYQQKTEESCNGWKREYTLYRKQQPQLLDATFKNTHEKQVRTYRNVVMNRSIYEDYHYALYKYDKDNEVQQYISCNPEFYCERNSEVSSPNIWENMPNTPEFVNMIGVYNTESAENDQKSEMVSTVSSMNQSVSNTRISLSSGCSGSNQPVTKKMKLEDKSQIKQDAVNILEHFNWKQNTEESDQTQRKVWLSKKSAQMLHIHLSVPKIIKDSTPIIIFFPEKGKTDFYHNTEEYTETEGARFIKEYMYVLSIQSVDPLKWNSVICKHRMNKIMEEINQRFKKDMIIMMGTDRGAHQAMVTYQKYPEMFNTVILNNPYLNTQSNHIINENYMRRLEKDVKSWDTCFYIGITRNKKTESKVRAILEIMERSKTMTVHSKSYSKTEDMIDDQMKILKNNNVENVTVMGYFMNVRRWKAKQLLDGMELEKFENFEKLFEN